MLYFAVSEASPWQATLGKRALSIRVATHGAGGRLSFRRTLLRAALKFAPWELAHTVLWRVEGWPLESPQPTTVHWLGFTLSLLWAGWYLVLALLWAPNAPSMTEQPRASWYGHRKAAAHSAVAPFWLRR